MRQIQPYSKSFISCFLLLLLFQTYLQSQSLNDTLERQYHWFIGFSGGPTKTDISSDFTPVISGPAITSKNSYCLSVDVGYFFSKYFGISTGIGLSPYITQLSLDPYSNSLDTIDSESESYGKSGQFSLSADGVITLGSLTCYMDSGKTIFVCTDTWSSGAPGSSQGGCLVGKWLWRLWESRRVRAQAPSGGAMPFGGRQPAAWTVQAGSFKILPTPAYIRHRAVAVPFSRPAALAHPAAPGPEKPLEQSCNPGPGRRFGLPG